MRKSWIEITCDACNSAEQFLAGTTDTQIRAVGWIVARDSKKHFCNADCRNNYRWRGNEAGINYGNPQRG